jgi:hypothetical protein
MKFLKVVAFVSSLVGAVIFFSAFSRVLNEKASYNPISETFFLWVGIGLAVIPRSLYKSYSELGPSNN